MSSPHLTPEEFREHGHRVVDWIADYWASVGERPVLAQVQPGEVAAALPTTIPERARVPRRRARRPRPRARPRPHALAAPALLRVLPRELLPRRRPRRPPLQRHRRPGDDLGDQPGRHRARAGRPRPAPRGARPPRRVRPRRRGRRRHPGHRVDGDLHRRPRRAAPGDRRRRPARRRTRRALHHLRLHAGALLPPQGRDDERPRRGRPSARSPSTRRPRPWTSPPCARRWPPTSPRA